MKIKESKSAKTICLDEFDHFPNTSRYLVMRRDEKKGKKTLTAWHWGNWPPNHMFYCVNAQDPGGPKAANTTFIVEFQF